MKTKIVFALLVLILFLASCGGEENVSPAPTSSPVPPTETPNITPTLGIGSTRISEVDGMVLVYVPEGEFEMGSEDGNSDEEPVHIVYLDAYWIGRTEVTNAMFGMFVEQTGHRTDAEKIFGYSIVYSDEGFNDVEGANWQHPLGSESTIQGLDDNPVVHVSWNDAVAYCDWTGGRLPTEAEWEKAARGVDGRTYPWGEEISCSLANYEGCVGGAQSVGSYPDGASPYGALDMAGNVYEWVADWYDDDYYASSPYYNPQGPLAPLGVGKVIRSGSWYYDSIFTKTTRRLKSYGVTLTDNVTGFRCVLSPPSATMTVIPPTATSTTVATKPPTLRPSSTPTHSSDYYFEVEDQRILNIYQSTDNQLIISVDLFAYYDEMPPIVPDDTTIPISYSDSVWSPQGRYLAFVGAIDGPSSDLYVFDTLTSEVKRLSSGPNQAVSPVWSPDGNWIVHEAMISAHGCQVDAVWAAKADGSEIKWLYKPHSCPEIVGWIGPSTYYVFDAGMGGRSVLRLVNIDKGSMVTIYDFSGSGGGAIGHDFDPESGAIAFYLSAPLEFSMYDPGFYLAAPWELTPTLLVPSRQDYRATVFWDEDQGVFITSEPCSEQASTVQAFTIEGTVSCVEPPP